jgi:iron(II)-dependent oxidoreductase
MKHEFHCVAESPSGPALAELLADARARTLSLVGDLDPEQMIGPRLPTVNPPIWEIGHVAWFQEFWVLRHLRRKPPLLEKADAFYNSTEVIHDTRWDLALPGRAGTLDYMQEVLDRVIEGLIGETPTPEEIYFHLLVLFHEDMHGEAIFYTRQALGYPEPDLGARLSHLPDVASGARAGAPDVEVPGGEFALGASRKSPFVFDNEKWAHPVEIKPFQISRHAVTNRDFLLFVEDDGYRRREFWSAEGWKWLATGGAPVLDRSFARFWGGEKRLTRKNAAAEPGIRHPIYWRRESDGRWSQRIFDRWTSLRDEFPVIHVNWYEAEAYCKWAKRRLPTEAEWEMAAAWAPAGEKRHFPWGDGPPDRQKANLDGTALAPSPVGDHQAGDSALGLRQMIGNVWEWTASDFLPYPGFIPDPYKEYSEPWFGTHKTLRGGCWATRARLIRNTWRNFYTPDRRDVWAGFRTCAEAES